MALLALLALEIWKIWVQSAKSAKSAKKFSTKIGYILENFAKINFLNLLLFDQKYVETYSPFEIFRKKVF